MHYSGSVRSDRGPVTVTIGAAGMTARTDVLMGAGGLEKGTACSKRVPEQTTWTTYSRECDTERAVVRWW